MALTEAQIDSAIESLVLKLNGLRSLATGDKSVTFQDAQDMLRQLRMLKMEKVERFGSSRSARGYFTAVDE